MGVPIPLYQLSQCPLFPEFTSIQSSSLIKTFLKKADIKMKRAKVLSITLSICLLSMGVASAATTGDPWLDQVVSFEQPPGSSDAGGIPVYALGSADDGLYVSIDIPEILTLAFTDNTAFNGVGDDLLIYEKFNSETIDVYVSADNRSYTYLGVAGQANFLLIWKASVISIMSSLSV